MKEGKNKITKKEEVLKKVQELCEKIAEEIVKRKNPTFTYLTRGSRNVKYDEKRDLILIGDKVSKRRLLDIGEARKFLQTVKTLERAYLLLKSGQHDTVREFYYTLKYEIPGTKTLIASDQRETDSVIYDLETALGVLREELHFTVDRGGAIVGPVTLIDRSIPGEVYEIDCAKAGRGGIAIPSTVEEIDLILQSDPEDTIVLAIETGGMFERLLELKFWKKAYNKIDKDVILILTKGQAKRAVRRLIHRFRYEFNLPVYIFTDCDPYGFTIASVIKRGSMNLSYLSPQLATPDAKFIGMRMTDIKKYGLESRTEPLTKTAFEYLKKILKWPWFQHPKWKKELELMYKTKKRIEQQALAARGITFVADVYLPEKILNDDYLP